MEFNGIQNNAGQVLEVQDEWVYGVWTGDTVSIPDYYARAKRGDSVGTVVGALNRNHGGRVVVQMAVSGDLITIRPSLLTGV